MKSIHLAQARYLNLPTANQTNAAVLLMKCRNMEAVLKRSLAYRHSRYPEQAITLMHSIAELQKVFALLKTAQTSRNLFLAEARATKIYWSSYRLFIRAPADWKRIHPGGSDPWNQTLNIGYTLLSRKVRAMIVRAGLDPEIGTLHASKHGRDALVYDLMELCRQPIVDVAVMRVFARVSNPSDQDPHQVIRECAIRCKGIRSYFGRRMDRQKIMELEIRRFKKAVIEGQIFQPVMIRL